MITGDDVLQFLKKKLKKMFLRLAGVGDEEITDSILQKTKRRFNWLLLNLFTALLATWVISKFGAIYRTNGSFSFFNANSSFYGW